MSFADERARMEKAIDELDLPAARKRAAKKQIRAVITIASKRAKREVPVGASRFGGRPDLPPGVEWPRAGQKYPMTFVAQFDLGELAPFDVDRALPKAGMLSFFVHDYLPKKVSEPETYSEHAVLFFPKKELVRAPLPKDFGKREPWLDATLAFETHVMMPSPYCGHEIIVDPNALAAPAKKKTRTPRPAGLLLGYDCHFGYDHPLDGDTRPIFLCTSDPHSEMNYGDAQDISFRIRDDDLARARFDRATLWIQAC